MVEQQLGGMSGFYTTPMASNEVNSIRRISSGSDARSRRLAVLMWINCVTSSTGIQKRAAVASSQVWLTFQGGDSSSGTSLSPGWTLLVGEGTRTRKTARWNPYYHEGLANEAIPTGQPLLPASLLAARLV